MAIHIRVYKEIEEVPKIDFGTTIQKLTKEWREAIMLCPRHVCNVLPSRPLISMAIIILLL